jgi:hypothetical protein
MNARKKNRRRSVAAVILALAIVLIAAAVLCALVCRVRTVRVEGNEIYSDSVLLESSGIKTGSFLFAVSRSAAAEKILHRCSVVKKAEVSIRLFDTVVIRVEEQSPEFYTTVGTSTVFFTADLRVTGVAESGGPTYDAVRCVLPKVKRADSGERIEFYDGTGEYISVFLKACAAEEAFPSITEIRAESERDCCLFVGPEYKLKTGGNSEIELKLKVGFAMLQNDRVKREKTATLDLSDPKEVVVKPGRPE